MKEGSGILLKENFINSLSVGGELAWFIVDNNGGSTGYSWKCVADNSGIYKLVKRIVLHPSVLAVGVPGSVVWQFEAIKPGEGQVLFQLYPPGGIKPVKSIRITIEVKS
ncbi:protease inhibitor I42 family protein [Zooshikella sp. RANM57]|uniref:protease inhibitor I42 family protein n=1 Tax=Zooshikella sp. RANM57 TaxID=3425863 RepID=UPI003D6DF6F0